MKNLRTFSIALLLVCTLLCSAACGKSDKKSPDPLAFEGTDYTLEIPIYAVTEETTGDNKTTYSGFIFNKYGKLLGKTAEGYQAGAYDYVYNEDGLLATETFTCSEGYLKTIYTYTEDGLVETKRYSSDYTSNSGLTYNYTYKMDEKNRPEETTITVYRGEYYTTVITYRYDVASNPVEETQKYYKYGVTATPDKTCLVKNSFNKNGNLVKSETKEEGGTTTTVTTYRYDCIDHKKISSKSETHLCARSEWKPFDEAENLPKPDSCNTRFRYSQKDATDKTTTYIYRMLANTDPAAKYEGADEYLQEYKTILTQLCDVTLEQQPDNSILLKKDEQTLATMRTGVDKQGNQTCSLTFMKADAEATTE